MNVSANIIRFPAQPLAPAPTTERQPQEEASVVTFSPASEDDRFGAQAQEHGQVFAAHRIVGRVADQLDSVANL